MIVERKVADETVRLCSNIDRADRVSKVSYILHLTSYCWSKSRTSHYSSCYSTVSRCAMRTGTCISVLLPSCTRYLK